MKDRREFHRCVHPSGRSAARPNLREPALWPLRPLLGLKRGVPPNLRPRPRVPWLATLLAGAVGLVWNSHAETHAASLASCRAVMVAAIDEVRTRSGDAGALTAITEKLAHRLEKDYPVCWQWLLQDGGPDLEPWLASATLPDLVRQTVEGTRRELGDAAAPWETRAAELTSRREGAGAEDWLDVYLQLADGRRRSRLALLRQQHPEWVFMKHHVLGGSHYAYTEGLSDAQSERQFEPGAALCLLDLRTDEGEVRTLVEDGDGVLRDPDVSWDGKRVLFAWKKSDREDDYHLHELEVATGTVRQLTHGLGFADYEGAYLPDGNLVFNSTRCVQTVDCWWTEVSNLYACRADGGGIRRLTFDQVHDNFPTVLPDGRVLYTRWEYNDRGQIFVQGLFQMNPDGTGQGEFYGNNSWFPTALLHARGIPGSTKVVAVFSGHHTRQTGKLGILDPSRGRQENAGTQLIAPVRATPAERVDAYGQDGVLFQYPYPLSETEFVVACAPSGWAQSPIRFGLYWVAADGRRELLADDAAVSCGQAVPLGIRPVPPSRPSSVDLAKHTGTCYVQDVYAGPGLAGVPRGTIARLRVIGLDFRAAGVGWNYNSGPAGDALVSTPVAVGNGSWDVKQVLGEATVHPDGSVFFSAPARQPFYLQAIDARGCAVQSMRSWMTLQPGENASCTGCHEDKNSTPPVPVRITLAFAAGPQELSPFHGPPQACGLAVRSHGQGLAAADCESALQHSRPRGFSFAREIQPVLDRDCVRCHHDARGWEARTGLGFPVSGSPGVTGATCAPSELAFSLQAAPVVEPLAKRVWSAGYLALANVTERRLEGQRYLAGLSNDLVNWVGAQSVPEMLAPYAGGAARSRLLTLLEGGHYGVRLGRADLERLACWIDLQVPFCGDYEEAAEWTPEEQAFYRRFLEKRRRMEGIERESP